jgi:hypothetical protein
MSGDFPGAKSGDPYNGMTPGNALGGGLTALDPATGLPYGADPMIDPATGLPRGYVQGQPQMNNPAFGGMTPGDALGGGLTMPAPQGFTPPPTWQRTQGSSSPMSMDVVDQYVDPATGQRYNMVGQPIGNPDTFGAPSLPGQYPNLMQNPAFNPAAGQPQPQPTTPPTLAQQIASPAPGVQQLIGQLSLQQRARPSMSQLSQMSVPQIQPPQPVQQAPIQMPTPSPGSPRPGNMDAFLRNPQPQPSPNYPGQNFGPSDLSLPGPPPPQPAPNPFVPKAQPAPVPQPQPRMPTQATQGYQSRIAPKPVARPAPVPVARPAPKPAPRPAPKPVAKPVTRPNPFQQSRLNRLGR